MADLLVARENAWIDVDGAPYLVHGGVTTAEAGHPVVEANPDLFKPLVPTFKVEDKPAPKKAAPKSDG